MGYIIFTLHYIAVDSDTKETGNDSDTDASMSDSSDEDDTGKHLLRDVSWWWLCSCCPHPFNRGTTLFEIFKTLEEATSTRCVVLLLHLNYEEFGVNGNPSVVLIINQDR